MDTKIGVYICKGCDIGASLDVDSIWMRLTQLYLGNLNRYFRYAKP